MREIRARSVRNGLALLAATAAIAAGQPGDYSLVEGFQIRPDFRQVSPGEQVTIEVVYCYRHKETTLVPVPEDPDELAPLVLPEHDDELAPLNEVEEKIRCDLGDDYPAPLLRIADVLSWKVNGIDGGNSELGTIARRKPNTASYTAPAASPDPDTVTVSADLTWGEKGKLVTTALIQITTPGRTYEGNMRYSAHSPGLSVTLSGPVTWREGEAGAGSFIASGRMNFNVSMECSRQDDKGRLQKGEAKFNGAVGFQGEMSFDVPAEGRYTFTVGTNWDDAPLVCNGITVPYGVLLVSPMCDFTPENESLLGDGRVLKGASMCDDGGLELEWSFARTQ